MLVLGPRRAHSRRTCPWSKSCCPAQVWDASASQCYRLAVVAPCSPCPRRTLQFSFAEVLATLGDSLSPVTERQSSSSAGPSCFASQSTSPAQNVLLTRPQSGAAVKTDVKASRNARSALFYPHDLGQAPTEVLGVSPTTTPRLTEAPVSTKETKK